MIERWVPEKYIHDFFLLGIFVKAFDGIVEILTSIILFFPTQLSELIHWLLRSWIFNSNQFLATHKQVLLKIVSNHDGLFMIIYLLSHGVIKIVLVAGLLYRKLWAYPAAIVVFSAFVVYQMYRYLLAPSSFMVFLSILDLIVIGLTWHEYKFLKAREQLF
ncbi:MAG TPA: DUF2127 domain-containing protein [Balneolaceae bacterium]|nr:DUF2127 domain-containing protein [Balneolaceae bacterium]